MYFCNMKLSFHITENDAENIRFERVSGLAVRHDFPMHLHRSLCIGLVTTGKRKMLFQENEIEIRENELFLVNILQPHAIEKQEAHDYIAITINGLSGCPTFNNHIRSLPCRDLFVELSNAIQNNDRTMLSLHWNRLFDCLCRHHVSATQSVDSNAIVKHTMAYVAENYQNRITVNDMAKHVCMSEFHFCRVFKSLAGISPHQYLIQYRLSRSYGHLRENDSVFDAAVCSGFYDSSHFIRLFYNYMALSPNSYRQSVAQNSKNIQREA